MSAKKLLAVLVLLGLAAAQSSLTLYTSEVAADVNALITAFQRDNPGIEVKVFRSGTGEVAAKIRAELEAGNPQSDLIWVANEDFFKQLAANGQLRRVPPTVSGYPVQYAPGGGLYYEVRLLYNVFGVNRQLVRQLPNSWQDLLRPEYRGRWPCPTPIFPGPPWPRWVPWLPGRALTTLSE
jgi:iron(III) transport system substrate-binding protein